MASTKSTQDIVIAIISNYTKTTNIGMKMTFDSLVIGPLDLESIRLDLEGEFKINLHNNLNNQWTKVKDVVGTVKRKIHLTKNHGDHKLKRLSNVSKSHRARKFNEKGA
jgi:acyl carrier protein